MKSQAKLWAPLLVFGRKVQENHIGYRRDSCTGLDILRNLSIQNDLIIDIDTFLSTSSDIISIGTGNTIVLLFSAEILFNV